MRDQLKTIGFATAVCLVCSVLLAFVSTALSSRQEQNRANDLKIKVLQVFGEKVLNERGKLAVSQSELDQLFETRISGRVLDSSGKLVEGRRVSELAPEDISERDKATGLKPFYPLYVYSNPATGLKNYAIHVSGKGLWSTIKGYIALQSDLSTIAGVVFYEHQETPGLGGEIEKDYFQDSFIGKRWLNDKGQINRMSIVKPGSASNDHSVDGITAATMTCIGVEKFLNEDFAVYNKYLEQERGQN